MRESFLISNETQLDQTKNKKASHITPNRGAKAEGG